MSAGVITYGPYHRAAAVLATFDPVTLRPAGAPADPESELDDLFADSAPANAAGSGRWQLIPRVRRAVLRQMAGPAEMQAALAANATAPSDPTQQMLAAAIAGSLPPLASQNTTELAALAQVVDWLDGFVLGLPGADAIQSRYEQLTLLEPFERLAGEHFRGRQQELATLRAFVGVLNPHTAQVRTRASRADSGGGEQPPRVIYGPGGHGKSALIARFIWEHATLPDAEKFPWIYLDFDRPMLQPESPLTLLVEGTRQLGLQYPHAREATDRIRNGWQERLARYAAAPGKAQQRDWASLLYDFQNLLEQLRLAGDPLLFVLDTFEQVQARPEAVVEELTLFLRHLQETTPQVRLLFSGRAPLPNPPLAREYPAWTLKQDILQPFGREEAQGFLENRGLPAAAAAEVAAQVTGTPLALVLAAELWRTMRAGGEQGPLLKGAEDTIFGFALRENEVEGILFGRILRRVHNPDVRAIAYPGLVLRRITPELIRDVLAGHCNVALPTPQRAGEIYAAMRREVQLVEERAGALRHRPELRRIMLRLMSEAGGNTRRRMDSIERAAIDFYSALTTPGDRAEEIYHRLRQRQEEALLDAAWKRGPVDLTTLYEALEELAPRERTWLKSHLPNYPLTPDERAEAALDRWELEAAARAQELLAAGQPAQALALLAERRNQGSARYLGSSPLYVLEVGALETLGRWQEVLTVAGEGLAAAEAAANRDLALELHLARMRSASRLGDPVPVHKSAAIAHWLAQGQRENTARALIRMEATYAYALRNLRDAALPEALERLQQHFAAAPATEGEGGPEPALAAYAGYLLAETDAGAVWRALRIAGLPADTAGLRRLAVALAEWDKDVSRRRKQAPGALARSRSLPEAGRLEESWTRALLDGGPDGAQVLLAGMVDEYGAAPPRVVLATAALLARRAAIEGWMVEDAASGAVGDAGATAMDQDNALDASQTTAQAPPAPDEAQPARVSPELARQVAAALVASFDIRELSQLLEFRLGVRLESIALATDFRTSVFNLVIWAQRRGQLFELVKAALDARPSHPGLRAAAAELGLTAEPAADDVAAFLRATGSVWEAATWRAQLGQIEGRVCRVELGESSYGTGFLVGPDLVLTSYAVMRPVVAGHAPPAGVQLRFDFRQAADGSLSHGVVYRLAPEWLAAMSEAAAPQRAAGDASDAGDAEHLDFALLRAAGAPGYDAVGGDMVESSAAQRGWLRLGAGLTVPPPGSALVSLDHAEGKPLRLYYALDAVTGSGSNGARLRYHLATAPGSAGAPIFSADLELVAMHQERLESGERCGVALAAVAARLAAQGLGWLLRDPDAPEPGAQSAGSSTPAAMDPALAAVLDRARQALDAGQVEIAQNLYTQAIEQAGASNDRAGEANARLGLAQLLQRSGQLAGSQAQAEGAQELFRAAGDRAGEAAAINRIGAIFDAQGETPRAVTLYEQELALVRAIGDRSGEGRALQSLGDAYINLGETLRAVELFEQRLPIVREIGDKAGEASTHYRLGNAAQQQREWAQAEQHYRQALAISGEIGDRYDQASVYRSLGTLAQAQQQWAQAEQHYRQALAVSGAISDLSSQALAYSSLGMLAQEQREWGQAEDLYRQALAISSEIGDRYEQASACYRLGSVAQAQQQWAQAEQHYLRALAIWTEFGDHRGQASVHYQLGSVAQAQQQWAQAEQHYQAALAIFIESDDRYRQASVHYQLGSVAQAQQQWAQAEQHYQSALSILIEFKDHHNAAVTYLQLGIVAQAQQQWVQAREHLLLAFTIFGEHDDKNGLGIAFYNLARLWRDGNDATLPAAVAAVGGIEARDIEEWFRQVTAGDEAGRA